MKGQNKAKSDKKKKRAAEKRTRISTMNNGYSKGRAFIPSWPRGDTTVPTMLIRRKAEEALCTKQIPTSHFPQATPSASRTCSDG